MNIKWNAAEFELEEKADVIFSNAVFRWIDADRQEKLAANLAAQLKPGGELVCEFGGKGCAETVHASLEKNFAKRGLSYTREFYFPTIGEYAPILERHGFRVEYAVLFDRPTVQSTEDGLRDWILMFDKKPFEGLSEQTAKEIIDETVEELRNVLFADGRWIVDYVRIRIKPADPCRIKRKKEKRSHVGAYERPAESGRHIRRVAGHDPLVLSSGCHGGCVCD